MSTRINHVAINSDHYAVNARFYEALFTGRFFLPSLYNTMIYSFGSAVIAIAIEIGRAHV